MVEHDTGEWVKYADYNQLEHELAEAREVANRETMAAAHARVELAFARDSHMKWKAQAELVASATLASWLSLTEAPMWVHGRDALVGEWRTDGWHKVAIWEPEWRRDDILRRGGTHWWPHLRDLPAPTRS